jgi:hypothetical protein
MGLDAHHMHKACISGELALGDFITMKVANLCGARNARAACWRRVGCHICSSATEATDRNSKPKSQRQIRPYCADEICDRSKVRMAFLPEYRSLGLQSHLKDLQVRLTSVTLRHMLTGKKNDLAQLVRISVCQVRNCSSVIGPGLIRSAYCVLVVEAQA